MTTILCYGDSNTWGFIPGSLNLATYYMERYPHNVRWPGLLQQSLGSDVIVAEAGLCGRTTNIDYQNIPDRNGKKQLMCSLFTHAPIDLVILMLGTNDLKAEFNRSADDVAQGNAELIDMIQASTFGPDMQIAPQILLVCPPQPAHENGFDGQYIDSLKRYEGSEQAYQWALLHK